jgi:hypothetical protein
MSTPEPLEQLRRDITSIQSSVGSLHTEVRLTSVRDSMEDLQTNLSALPQRIRDLRTRGYVFEKALEKDAADLAQTWTALRPSVEVQIERQAMALQQEMRPLEAQLNALAMRAADPVGAGPLVTQLKASIGNMENKARAAASSVSGMYDGLQSQYNQLNSRLSEADWMLKQLAEASFRLLATEAGIAAVKAVWVQGGKEDSADPKGVLYVTDQRLVFEQKQEVATKKVLFITTEKQKVQQLGLEVPLGLIESVKASKQGLFGHEDHLDLKFAAGASADAAHFHIDGQDSNRWQGLIGRAKAGDFDQDRAVAVDQAQVARVRAAPTVCPRCGAAMTAPVLRGVDSIKCAYCGNVVRL